MPTAFSDAADFSGISDDKLKIDEVVHKTHIDVTAEGTKAAAATAVVMTRGISVMNAPDVKKVRLDRPFVYMILDMTNELPGFIGTVQGLSYGAEGPNGARVVAYSIPQEEEPAPEETEPEPAPDEEGGDSP